MVSCFCGVNFQTKKGGGGKGNYCFFLFLHSPNVGVPSNFISDLFREKIIISNLQPGPTGPSLLPDRGRYILHDCLIGKGIIKD